MSQSNIQVIQDVYAAFGRGDVAAIVEHSAPDTAWSFNGAAPGVVPWHTPQSGKQGIPQFIGALMGNVELESFEPRDFVSSGDSVIAHIHLAYVVKSTGKRVDEEQLHWWKLDPTGRITSLVHYEDTRQVVAACSP